MLGHLSPKIYAVIALITAGLLYGINWLDGGFNGTGTVVRFLNERTTGTGMGAALGKLVTRPIEFAISHEFGGLVGGLLWPMAIIWLFLLVFMIVLSFMAPFVSRTTCAISDC